MSAKAPLMGNALITCAKANASQGVGVAAQSCGFGENHDQFRSALKEACTEIGVEIDTLKDLISEPQRTRQSGVEISPDSPSQL